MNEEDGEEKLVSFGNKSGAIGPVIPHPQDRKIVSEFLPVQVLQPKTTTDLDTNPVLSNISVPKQINIDMDIDSPIVENSILPFQEQVNPTVNFENSTNDITNPKPQASLYSNASQSLTEHGSSILNLQIPLQTDIIIPSSESNVSIPAAHTMTNSIQVDSPTKRLTPLTVDLFEQQGTKNININMNMNNDSSIDLNRKFPNSKDSLSISPNGYGKSLKFSLNSDANKIRSSIYESKSTVKAIPIRKSSGTFKQHHMENEDSASTRSTPSSMTASLSRSFLFAFYNTNRQKNKKQAGILSKEYWMKDESAKECFSCAKTFNTFRRKHHCRMCGQIFCSACTLLMTGEKFGYNGKMRVCYNCSKNIENYQDSSDDEEDISYAADKISQSGNIENTSHSIPQGTPEIPQDDRNGLNSNIGRSLNTGNPELEQLQQKILLLQDDDVHSIITSGDDSKLFIQTPPPPPRMTIPATKQGGSLEIFFDNSSVSMGKNLSQQSILSGIGIRDRYTLRDIDLIQTSPQFQFHADDQSVNKSPPFQNRTKKRASMNSLRRSIFNYVGNNTRQYFENSPPNYAADSIIGNINRKNFKFEFNYMPKNTQNPLSHESSSETVLSLPQKESSNNTESQNTFNEHIDSSEDEGSMSIYSSLHDISHSDNPIRSMRNSSRSSQRAQASLQRMRTRRKSRSKGASNSSLSAYRNFQTFTHSTPNLISVVSDDDHYKFSHTSPTKIPGKVGNGNIFRRLSSMSGVKYSKEAVHELNEVALLHMNSLLEQVLGDQDLLDTQTWVTLLTQLLKKVQTIELTTKYLNTLDFRQTFVKIKRIPGGSISDCEYIQGVVFSKSLPSKTMPKYVANPRILLIMFPLEYQKNENQFLSLRTVFDQEKEYLDKLVLRLTSLSPDIIFVGANVSGYALDLLDKAGVVVQYGIKPQVMERIARVTESDIAISIDKLAANVKMGECESFEVKSFIYGNVCKTYTFLRGCNGSLGSTILLRGAANDVLRKIKDVTEFMVYAVFSLKLESSFFNDNFIHLSTDFYLREKIGEHSLISSGYFSDFLDQFNRRILSVSPSVEFPIPYLLQKARTLELQVLDKKHAFTKYMKDTSFSPDILPHSVSQLGIASTLTQSEIKYLVKFMHQKELEFLELEFERRSHQWEVSYSLSNNMLGTGSHQSITVLYSMVSKKTATPCTGPQIVTIDYFWDSDISIGQFIENVVGTATYPCRQGCDCLLIDHYRSYVHGSGKVDVLIEKFQTRIPRLADIILTWSYCKKCGTSTPILQMSEKTWNFSFGKYLEIIFWSNKNSMSDIGNCNHNFTKDHVKYFAYNDLVVRLEYSDLEVYELITPPRVITWKSDSDIKMKVELYYQILEKINSFYESVTERINRIKLDSIPIEKLSDAEKCLGSLSDRVNEEKKSLFESLDTIYRKYSGDQHLQLNKALKAVYDKAITWDSEFTKFAQHFLPSENDVSKITSNQLKKILNKPPKEEISRSISRDNSPNTIHKNILNETIHGDNFLDIPGRNEDEIPPESYPDNSTWHDCTPNPESTIEINDLVESPETSSDKIKLNEGSKSLPQSFGSSEIPISAQTKSKSEGNCNSNQPSLMKENIKETKVEQLAQFFNQLHLDAISKEFELQRELERLQLNRNKYKINRLHSSTPIAEIYKDVQDAVEEPLHSNDVNTPENNSLRSLKRKSVTPSVTQSALGQNLENELENSIHLWNESLLHNGSPRISNSSESARPNLYTKLGEKLVESQNPHDGLEQTKNDTNVQPEKSLLMKTLKTFWADRSASLWKPLEYPLLPTEHIFADNDVIIREDEPSSFISFCLSTADHKSKMAYLHNWDPQLKNNNIDEIYIGEVKEDSESSINTEYKQGELSEGKSLILDNPHSLKSNSVHDHISTFSKMTGEMKKQSSKDTTADEKGNLETVMTKKTAVHLRYQFEEGETVMSCKIFFAEQFEAFRRRCGCHENFIQSLSRCIKWDSNGGKSGSGFLKTLDDRFIIKELSHMELDAFIKFAPSYFEYMAQAMFHDLPTALAKVFGFYQIQVKSTTTGSKSYKMDVIIMENLFYKRKTSRIFDLKGSMRNRHVEQTGKENEVLLDENMIEYIYESPIHVREYDKKLLRASLWNDTLFLAKMNVMDYSLVIGIDNDGCTLTVGIIDFIRTFTWDKKLESWVKEKGLVGGGSTKLPTVVTPKQYKNRFREAMERYILMVPDPWYRQE
ncbi:hypothetical protein TBLA_0A10150 [Henningerozyma blattae CBS 6284]|uniref:1-phosphatidylinositol-3-phosphate 5-kinase n=1 Tax=Henningerozyma blattae (strain ATCC 34711 / CBS 6284 / DSM 70876 / NBRC 10599 / NRRL Y-10934 / UCD 77-7) TaxID=1071380 RepID=I2GXE2_HENB6|nr:hypothetical protein TBLA_0A10150 [Tetrapisispora blattae CBS 6284]CCH58794.1 hypothetical protein TBLA_0A10150 [Tetrapisispora blattae CBS 6284]